MADLSVIKKFLAKNGGVLAPGAVLEEENYIAEEIEHTGPTTNIEAVDVYQIAPNSDSEFEFFEDGVQRTLYVGHLIPDGFHIPVHFCTVASVILRREQGRFSVVDGLFKQRELLLISKANVSDPSSLDMLEDAGIEVIDTETAGKNFNELSRSAQRVSKRERLNVERDIIEKWAEQFSGNSFLIVDGTIMNLRSQDAVKRCLGVSKQLVERYFGLQNHRKVLGLNYGERSWVFNFKTEDDDQRMGARDRLSWYLRIRDPHGRHPEFGLLRCEISMHHRDAAGPLADRLSSSLIAERNPIAFPDTRWDRLLYPIRQCEEYIRSRCRPVKSVQAAFGRMYRI